MEFCAHGKQANHGIECTVTKRLIPTLRVTHHDEPFRTAGTIFGLVADPRLEHQ
jgi:hypothetical protein